MRITQQMIFQTSLDNMNSTLSALMESNTEGASQKRINSPSDDPVGMTKVLNDRTTLSSLNQYSANITTAQGWLGLADSTLTQASSVITEIKTLATQAATGTMTADNRQAIGTQVQQYFEELINMANTKYEGQSIFAGQKTSGDAFDETLGLTVNQSGVVSNAGYSISGDSDSTILVQFLQSGPLSNGTAFRYSTDGGNTFSQGTVVDPGGNSKLQLNLGGVDLQLARGTTVTATSATNTNDSTGTWMWVRPAVQYNGNDNSSIAVDPMQGMGSTVEGQAAGNFSGNVLVRINNTASLASNVSYTYSVDGGRTWSASNTSTAHTAASSASLNLPGGILTLYSNGGNLLQAGNMFMVRPSTANINFEIGPSSTITVNGIGSQIFGGLTEVQSNGAWVAASINGASNGSNLFETVGELVGYLETNNQDGVQKCLANLTSSQQTVLNYDASVGGRENRLTTTSDFITNLNTTVTTDMSNTEDVDLSLLMTNLAQQQLAYETVLKATSMINGLSLLNYM